jgi:16S rRNA (adenine1518-N6/adenine1519-N6)-dimethyltransferase
VVRLTIKSHDGFDPIRHERFRRLVRASFAHRRKTLVNSLRDEGYPAGHIARAMEAAEIPLQARAEMLSLDTYRTLARAFEPDPS